jgi:hypothetical protein
MSTYGINAYRTLIVSHIVRAGFSRMLRPVLEHSLKPYRRGLSFIGETLRLEELATIMSIVAHSNPNSNNLFPNGIKF